MTVEQFRSIDGSYYFLLNSCTEKDFPEMNSIVRATMVLGGWCLIPLGENETKVIYTHEINSEGTIANGMMLKQAISKAKGLNEL